MNELIIDTGINTSGFEAGSKELMKAIKSFGKTASRSFGQFGNFTKRLMKLAPSLLGIGSAMAVLAKSVSSYMSTNEQLTKKLNSAFAALGQVMAPVLNFVVDLIVKAISYLIDFLHLVGLSSKSAKQAGAAAQAAAGAMQKSLMGFDELNILQKGSGVGNLGDYGYELPEWLKEIADLIKSGEFEEAGRALARKMNEVIDMVDWGGLGKKLSNAFRGVLQFLYGVIDEFDWNKLGRKILEFLKAIDWGGIFKDLLNVVVAALEGAFEFIWGLLGNDIGDGEQIPIVRAFETLKKKITDFADKVRPIIEDIWKNVIKPFLEWTIDTALPKVLDLISTAVEKLGEILESWYPHLKKFWDEFLQPVAEWAGEHFIGLLDDMIDLLGKLADLLTGKISFGEFLGDLDGAEGGILAVVAAIEGLKIAKSVAENVGGLISTIKKIKNLDTSVGTLGKLAEVMEIVGGGAGNLFEALNLVFGNTGNVTSATQALAGSATNTAAAVGGLGTTLLGLSPLVIGGAIALSQYKKEMQDMNSWLEENITTSDEAKAHMDEMSNRITAQKEAIESVTEAGGITDSMWDELNMMQIELSKTTEMYNQLLEVEKSSTQGVEEAVTSETESLNENKTVQEGMGEAVEEEWQGMEQAVDGSGQNIVASAEEMVVNTSAKLDEMNEKVSSSMSQMEQKTSSAMNNINSSVNSALSSLASKAYSWGMDMGNSLARGIRASRGSVASASSMLASTVKSYLHFSEPDKGPLSDFHTYMPDMIKLMASGILENKKLAVDAVRGLAEDMADEMQGTKLTIDSMSMGEVNDMISDFSDKMIKGFEDLIYRMKYIAGNIAFEMPSMATGNIVPYNVGNGVSVDNGEIMSYLSEKIGGIENYLNVLVQRATSNNQTLEVYLDGMSMARRLYTYNKQVEKEHGESLISK